MISKETFDFLHKLKANNDREWFRPRKPLYEAARDDVQAFAERLREEVAAFDAEVPLDYPMKKAMYRIHRDTRFSKDKRPYKHHIAAIINDNGALKNPLAGYYLSVEPGNCFIACGCYAPEKEQLKLLRDAFDLDWELFEEEVMGNELFRSKIGDLCREDKVLKRVPNGYPKESPAAEYLKLTSFYGYAMIDDKVMRSPQAIDEAVMICKALFPLKTFLNRALRYSDE